MTLRELMDSGRTVIHSDEAAKIIGMNPVTLRNSIQAGTCPFGFEASAPRRTNKNYVVSVLAMVNWLTKSHYAGAEEYRKDNIT